jgi:glutathione peroxidase-family protein
MLSMFGGGAASAAPSGVSSFYDLKEKDASGGEVDFSQFRGKVVYAVNVASR